MQSLLLRGLLRGLLGKMRGLRGLLRGMRGLLRGLRELLGRLRGLLGRLLKNKNCGRYSIGENGDALRSDVHRHGNLLGG